MLIFNVGPVLLDFPYVYKLDGNKLYCNAPSNNNPSGCCEGIIDYDPGFNHLFCTKCGVRYKAKELEKAIKDDKVIVKSEGEHKMKVSVKGGSKNVSKTIATGEYADLAKKTPSKPILGRENMMSNTQIKAEQKEVEKETNSIAEKSEDAMEIRDVRREVRPAISIDPNFKSIKDRFKDLAEDIMNRTLSKDEKESIIASLLSLNKSFDLNKESDEDKVEDVLSFDSMVEKFKDLKDNNSEDANNFAEYIIDSLNLAVNFNALYLDKETSNITYEIDILFYNEEEITVWSNNVKLAVNPLDLLDPLYKAGYKISSDDNSGAEFVSGSEFSGDFKYFAAKVINVKDINQDLQPNKVITIVNSDGNYLTIDGDIIGIDMIDDRSVQSISIVSKHWLDETMKELEELRPAETEDESELEQKKLPTGVLPPVNEENNDEDSDEKYVNGVPVV